MKRTITALAALFLTAGAMSPVRAADPGAVGQAVELPRKLLMVYEDSWWENAAQTPAQTALASLPGYINLVVLAASQPDMAYAGGLDLGKTGFSFKLSGPVLRDSIALLKSRHPETRVLVGVGNGLYSGWAKMNEAAIARLVHDLGADGVDVDYEPEAQCKPGPDGRVACDTDRQFIDVVTRIRRALPRPLLMTVAGWHVGAYGEGEYRDAPPAHSPHAGVMLALFRDAKAASGIDLVSIDAYDAGTTYDPMQAYRAYRKVWPGRLALGVEVPMRNATGPFYTVKRTEELAREVAKDPKGGMMVYSMLEPPFPLPATVDHPTGAMLEQAACRGLEMTGCDLPAPPPGR